MKSIVAFVRQTSVLEAVLFTGVVCLAVTAGYASLTTSRIENGDITGSTHPSSAPPLARMQPMPDAIEPQH